MLLFVPTSIIFLFNLLFLIIPYNIWQILSVFSGASAFNSDLSKWDVSAVTDMFQSKYIKTQKS